MWRRFLFLLFPRRPPSVTRTVYHFPFTTLFGSISWVAPPRLWLARGLDTYLLEPGGVVILGVVEQIIDVAVADQIRAIKPGPFPFGAVLGPQDRRIVTVPADQIVAPGEADHRRPFLQIGRAHV